MGTKFSLETFIPGDVSLHDIAHSLSMSCRYGGHCREFYSVAEHSVILAELILEQYGDTRLAYNALMHDATEAYVCDLPRPIKYKLLKDGITWFQEAETQVWGIICQAFGTQFLDVDMDPRIKQADERIIRDERGQNMNPSTNHWATDELEPLGVVIECWSPSKAYVEFIRMEHKLQEMLRSAG